MKKKQNGMQLWLLAGLHRLASRILRPELAIVFLIRTNCRRWVTTGLLLSEQLGAVNEREEKGGGVRYLGEAARALV